MEFRQIAEDLAVAGQITADQVAAIKDAGFKSLVCNRPDNEEYNQPRAGDIEAAAKAAGLEYRLVPVSSGNITQSNVEDMAKALEDLPRPLLAYCRSGARSFSLIQIVKVIPEIMHGLTEIEEADETMAPECCPMCPNLADGTLSAHVTLPSTARSN